MRGGWRYACLALGIASTAHAVLHRQLLPDGIELRLEFSRARVYTVPGGHTVAVLGEFGALFPPDSAAAAAEVVVLFVAVPQLSPLPELHWQGERRRGWDSLELATVGEVSGNGGGPFVGSLEPSVELRSVGIWRGIPVAAVRICPWGYDPERQRLELWERLSLRLRYGQPVAVEKQRQWAPGERDFAGLLLNPEQALVFRRQQQTFLRVDEPFRFQKPLLRVATTRDGIAMVLLRDVLALMPEWRGRPSQGLELLWRGAPMPSLLLDRNGVVDEEDTLLFLGRRPAGDTTWWDFYSAEESFFLVLHDSAQGRRFAPLVSDGAAADSAQILPVLFHWEKDRVYVPGENVGTFRLWTETAPGEGWYWATLRPGTSWRDSLFLPALGPVRLRMFGYALNSVAAACEPGHRLRLVLNGDTLGLIQREGPGELRWEGELGAGQWRAGWNRLELISVADTASSCAVAEQALDAFELELRPQPVAVQGEWRGAVSAAGQPAGVRLRGFSAPRIALVDTLHWRATVEVGKPEGQQFAVSVVLAAQDTAFLWVAEEGRWERARLERLEPSSVLEPEPQADVIVVTVPQLLTAAQQWADYRQRTHGVRTRIVLTRDIAASFGYGRLNPHVLKAFLSYAYTHWAKPAPQFLLLLGTANWDGRNLLGYSDRKPNWVPSYGVPPSDYWYTLLEGDDYLPELFVGRIPAADSAEAQAVLDKLVAWEQARDELWRKRALLIFGSGFNDTMDTYYSWLSWVLGMNPTVVQKTTPEPSSSRWGPQIRQVLQEGAGVTIYFGHGAEANMEVQGWEPQRLANTERQGLLMTLSCSMGNFAVPYVRAFNEQYVVAARRGMVAALGMSGIGWDIVERTVRHNFFQALVEQKLRLLGPLYAAARLPLAGFVSDDIYRATVLQHTLLGDPLLQFPVDTLPELVLMAPSPSVHRGDGVPVSEISEGDSLWLRIIVGNLGLVPQQKWRIRVVHLGDAGQDTVWIDGRAVRQEAVWDTLLPAHWRTVGLHTIRVELNPDSLIPERSWHNNSGTVLYRVHPPQLLPLEPLPFWHVQQGRPRFRVLNPLGPAEAFRYEAEVWQGEQLLARAIPEQLRREQEVVDWTLPVSLPAGQSYRFRIRAVRDGDTLWTQWLEVPFWVDTASSFRWVCWRQADSVDFSANVLEGMEIVRGEHGEALVRLGQWRAGLSLLSDPVRSRAEIALSGALLLELEQESGIGAVVFGPGREPSQPLFYRTGRSGQSAEAQYFLQFLRDSVPRGAYVAWVISGDGLWRFSAGQLDTLRQVLRREYGARLADSLAPGVGYAFVGRRGGVAGSAAEAVRRGDSLRLVVEVQQPLPRGRLRTPWIGPAHRLQELRLRLSAPQQWVVTVYGRSELQEQTSDILVQALGDTLFWLADERYAYIQLELEASAPEADSLPLPALAELRCTFEPQGELAVVPASLEIPVVLLGDTLSVQVRVWNRSLRAEASGVRLQLGTRTATENTPRWSLSLPAPIGIDTAGELLVALPTVGWQPEGGLWLCVAAPGELYRFNNCVELPYRFALDTVPPVLQLWWQDGATWVRLDSGSAVSRQPRLWLVVSDNNRAVPLGASAAPRVWIEGRALDSATAVEYRFYSTAELDSLPAELRLPGVRAALRFVPQRLPLGPVLLWCIAEDAAGLRDTLSLELRVTDQLTLELLRQYPTPSRGSATVEFVYEGYRASAVVRAEVYSLQGQRLFGREFPLVAGRNQWQWDGRSDDGIPVAPGVYLWRLWLPQLSPTMGLQGVFVVLP